MKYTYNIELKNFEFSIEKILKLEKFVLEKLNAEEIKTEIFLSCGACQVSKTFLSEIFDIDEIKDNFLEITSIYARYSNAQSYNENIIIQIYNADEYKSLRMKFDSKSKAIAIENKQLFENFLSMNFKKENVKIEKDVKKSLNINNYDKANKKKVNKPLQQFINTIILSKEDLLVIEDLILQDLHNDYKYLILLKPSEKYIEKNPNAKEYSFETISQIDNDIKIWKDINNYDLTMSLNSTEINIELKLEQNTTYNLSQIFSSGSNQTLYYGKFYLLKDFLKFRKPWYWFLYKDFFITMLIIILISIISVLYSISFILMSGFTYKKLLFCGIPLLFFFALRAMPKIKIDNNLKNLWIKDPTIQFLISIFLMLLSIILPYILPNNK